MIVVVVVVAHLSVLAVACAWPFRLRHDAADDDLLVMVTAPDFLKATIEAAYDVDLTVLSRSTMLAYGRRSRSATTACAPMPIGVASADPVRPAAVGDFAFPNGTLAVVMLTVHGGSPERQRRRLAAYLGDDDFANVTIAPALWPSTAPLVQVRWRVRDHHDGRRMADLLRALPGVVSIDPVGAVVPQLMHATDLLWHGDAARFEHHGVDYANLADIRKRYAGQGVTVGVVEVGPALLGDLFIYSEVDPVAWTSQGRPAPATPCLVRGFPYANKVCQYVVYRAEASGGGVGLARASDTGNDAWDAQRPMHGTGVVAAVNGEYVERRAYDPDKWLYEPVRWSPRVRCYDLSGMAPRARVSYFELGASSSPTVTIPGLDLGEHVLAWAYASGARIHLNAWTVGGGVEGRRTGYDWLARDVDRYMYGRQDALVICAAGRQDAVVSPGLAKNALTVGVSLNPGRQVAKLSAHWLKGRRIRPEFVGAARCNPTSASIPFDAAAGPTADGRIKPDLVAPGYMVVVAQTGADRHRFMFACDDVRRADVEPLIGSSVSAALVAGLAAIFRQFVRERYRMAAPSAALIKALLIHSAKPIDGPRLDRRGCPDRRARPVAFADANAPNGDQGWGRPEIHWMVSNPDSVFFPGYDGTANMPFGDPDVGNGQRFVSRWCVRPGASQDAGTDRIVVTLVWTDPPAEPLAPIALVNDLDLVVEYRGATYRGNMGATAGQPDRRNNVEKVVLPALPGSAWWAQTLEIVVEGHRVVTGTQPFSLVLTGNVRAGGCDEAEAGRAPVYEKWQARYTANMVAWLGVYVAVTVVFCTGACAWAQIRPLVGL